MSAAATSAAYKENFMLTRLLRILTALALWPALVHAQAMGSDTPEAGSVEEIAKATTEPRFLSPWVSYLPASATVVSPRAFLQRIPGAPGEIGRACVGKECQ